MTHQVYEALQNKGLKPGTIVLSKAGHDRGRVYLVIQLQLPFVLLADGDKRSVARPKKKRVRHVKALGQIEWGMAAGSTANGSDSGVMDAAIRKKIQSFIEGHQPKEDCPCPKKT